MDVDPYSAVPQPKKIEPVVQDFRDNFWRQVPDMRPTVGRTPLATHDRCIFDHGARRVYHRPNCEHALPDWWDDETVVDPEG